MKMKVMPCGCWIVVGVGLTEYFLLHVGRLAKLTAAVLLAKDVPVYFFSTYVPTPFVVSRGLLFTFFFFLSTGLTQTEAFFSW